MNFIETRGNDPKKEQEVTFSQAILSPSASFGGLYVPKNLPKFEEDFFEKSKNLSYKELALKVLKKFEIDIEDDVLIEALNLYDKFDESENPVPLVKIGEDLFVNELYHGPTRAFKDMALVPFGHILSNLAQKKGEKYLILAATSGDTGPATLDTFANKDNVYVVCLYPDGGTSDVQRLQMVTEEAPNLKVIGIKGNFDDAQNALKKLLASQTFKEELSKKQISLSAANSVNFGRIIFQTIYHIKGYLELIQNGEIEIGEKIYIVVPSGNFGNALGAYYAKEMGMPVEKILITSNANNILTQLIEEGKYDLRDKHLVNTISPAMDILKSSNVERILFDKFGYEQTYKYMESLEENGFYELSNSEQKCLRDDFRATYSLDDEILQTIKKYLEKGYLMDPHTATCIRAYENLREKPLKTIVCSTAEWTKFAPSIAMALDENKKNLSDLDALREIEVAAKTSTPQKIKELFSKKIIHTTVVDKNEIEKEILNYISVI